MTKPKSVAAPSLAGAQPASHCFADCLPGFFSCWPLPLPGIPRPRPPNTPVGQKGRAERQQLHRKPVTTPTALKLFLFSQIRAYFLVFAAAEMGSVGFSLASPGPCTHQEHKLTSPRQPAQRYFSSLPRPLASCASIVNLPLLSTFLFFK